MTSAINVAGEALLLHHDRAVFWPAQSSLLVTDVHLGKGAVFRRAGIAVPSGDTLSDLHRLDRLIAHFAPRQLLVLGDLVHGSANADTPWLADVRRWRDQHAAIGMTLIAGNHDRHFDSSSLGFEVVTEAMAAGPFLLSHEPATRAGQYVLAGHVHPGVVVRDGWRRHRLPAFVFGKTSGLLPAFGSFTGLYEITPAVGDRIVAATPGGLLPVTPRG
jgi:DNA ligase-associated metallophosphoesterase